MSADPTVMFCVGATKSGTSWLYRHLAGHPDCHFRTIKELHYFDHVENGTVRRALRQARQSVSTLAARMARAGAERRDGIARQLADLRDWVAVLARPAPDAAAYLGYLSAGARGTHVVGDVTPAYALLPESRLFALAALAPDTRFVYLMRDPVERLWSHVRMAAVRRGRETDHTAASCAIMERVIAGDPGRPFAGIAARGDYAGALARLDRTVAPARLLPMFTEDMLTRPGIERLWSFLGIGPHAADFGQPAFRGRDAALPDSLWHKARGFLAAQYRAMADRFGRLPEAWQRGPGGVAT